MNKATRLRYELWAINDKTGREECLTSEPVTLNEAFTIRSKFNPYSSVRLAVLELPDHQGE